MNFNFSYPDLKATLYVVLAVGGIALLGAALHYLDLAVADPDPVTYSIAALTLLVVGVVSIFFSVESFYLRDDPDIWR